MLRRVISWESPKQEENIRQWLANRDWLLVHGYSEHTREGGLTEVQLEFLRDVYALGNMPTDGALLQKVDGFIQARPAWLVDLERIMTKAKERIQIISTEDFLQWTDEQLIAALKAGKALSFTDINWGLDFLIIWNEQEQNFYDLCGAIGEFKPFKSITAHIIYSLCKEIELLEKEQNPLVRYLTRRFLPARPQAEAEKTSRLTD